MLAPSHPPEPAIQLDPENPWPGLESFEENAHRYFHGRDNEAEELLRRVVDAPVTVLFGKSGLGKTSLLKAGLFPRLRAKHFFPVHVRLDIRPGAPALVDQLRDALLAAIADERVDASGFGQETLWEYLHRADLELWSEQNYPLVPVLVLDQFEELFTLGERLPREVERFKSDLGDLAENRIPVALAAHLSGDATAAQRLDLRGMPYKLVVTLREDFLPHLEGWRSAIPSLGGVRVRLLPMRPDQALSAVYDTAPHLMDEPLARRIVAFVGAAQTTKAATGPMGESSERASAVAPASEIEPALLSLFCRGLNDRRKRQGKERFDEQLLEGVQQSIIADYYRESVEGLPETVSRFIESELITAKGFRNSYAKEDAVPRYLSEDQLQQLIDRRLLRLEERYGTSRIELTHDVLTRAVLEHRIRRQAEDEKAALARQEAEQREALEAHATRQRRRLMAMAFFALVCLALAGVAVWQWRAALEAKNAAQIASNGARRARDIARSAEALAKAEGQRAVYQEKIARAQADLAAARAAEAISAREAAEQQARVALSREVAAIAAPMANASAASDRELGVLLAMQAVWATYSADRRATREAEDALRQAAGGSVIELPFPGHGEAVEGIAFSPDGARLATCAADGIRVWDAASGTQLRTVDSDPGSTFDIPSDCGQLAFGSGGIRVASHRARTRQPSRTVVRDVFSAAPLLDQTGSYKDDDIEHISFSPDGTRLIAADHAGRLSAWEFGGGRASKRALRATVPKSRRSAPLIVSADGTRIAIMDEDGILHVTSLREHEADAATHSLRLEVGATIALSPDGALLAAAGRVNDKGDVRLQVLNAVSGEEIVSWDSDRIDGMVFSFPDGRHLATVSGDKGVAIWDVANRFDVALRTFPGQLPIAFSADGLRLAVTQGTSVDVRDVRSGEELTTLFGRREASLGKAAFGAGTARVATASQDGKIRIWDTASARPVHTLAADEHVELVALSRSADRVAAWGRNRGLRVWQLSAGGVAEAPVVEDLVSDVTFTAGGTQLVTGAPGGAITIRAAGSGRPLAAPDALRLRESRIFALEFSRDEKRLATATVQGAMVHDIATGRALLDVPGLRFDLALAGEDGRWLAVAGGPSTEVWDVTARKKLGRDPIPGLGSPSEIRRRRLALRDDGRLLATIDQAGRTVSVWDCLTGARRTTLHRHPGDILAIAFTPDGTQIAVVLADWSVHVHPIAIEGLLALGRERVSRSLTTEECQRYLGRPDCPAVRVR